MISAVCLYFVRFLFTFDSYLFILYQLFVYLFSCLLTFQHIFCYLFTFVGGMFDDYMALAEGREFNKESITGFYTKMAEHIKQEKQRIGGSNWAVAQAVPFQWLRQHIKEIIGPDCIFVVMSMTEETQASRVEKRHADLDEGMKTFFLDMLKNMAKSYEDAGENEENAVNVRIAPEDTEQDVIDKILEAVKPFQ